MRYVWRLFRYGADKFLIAFFNHGIPDVIVTWNLLYRYRITIAKLICINIGTVADNDGLSGLLVKRNSWLSDVSLLVKR